MQVFKIAYSDYFDPTKTDEWNQICQAFVTAVQQCQPDMLNKQKVHLMLHLVECMKEFGPSSSFNSERYVLLLLYIIDKLIIYIHVGLKPSIHSLGLIIYMETKVHLVTTSLVGLLHLNI